ncbi:MAG: hypothetical protein ABID54_10020, partial [Pseudomonadota bacterium]
AAALGTKGPLKVALDGKGPLKAWRGRLTATVGSLGSLDVKIRLKAEKDYALSASGTVRVDPSFLPARIASVLSGENQFSLAVGFQGEKRLVVHRLTVEAGHSNFLLTGEIGITNLLLKGDFTLTTKDLSLLETSVGTGLAGRLAVQGSLFGSLKNPGATLHVSLDGGRVSGLRIANLAGNLHLELLAPLSFPFPGLRVKGKGSASGLDYPALQPPLVSQIDWIVEAEVSPGVTISVNKLELTGENLALAFRGRVDTRRSLVLGDVDVEVGDIGLIAGYWTHSFRGATRLRAKLRANWDAPLLSASIKGRLTELQQDFLPMISSFAPEVDYAATVEISEDKELTITGLRLAAEAAQLTGTGSLHLGTKAIMGRWQLSLPQLTALSKSPRRRVRGSVEMEGKVRGSLSALTMVVKAKGENIHVRNIPFQHVSATLRASGPPLGREGHLELVIRNQGYTVTATTKFALDGEELSLSKISITAPGRTAVRGEHRPEYTEPDGKRIVTRKG